MDLRDKVEKLAASVPNVQQVVNELDVKTSKKHKSSGM
jgi:osmotically-inducible protein OsmY